MTRFELRWSCPWWEWYLTCEGHPIEYYGWRWRSIATARARKHVERLCDAGGLFRSLRIWNKDDTSFSEFTYPRSADPRRSKG